MSLIRNKKAVEALPLRYIIIALVAAIVVGIALQFTGILKTGILSTAEKINESTATQTTCALDTEHPLITGIDASWSSGSATIDADLSDECGIETAIAYLKQGSTTKASVSLELDEGNAKNGTWSGDVEISSGTYNITVWAEDDAANPNENTKTEENVLS